MLPIFIGSASSAVILSYYAKMISYAAFQLLSLVTLFYLSLGYPTRVSDNSDKLYSDLIAELRSQQVTAGKISRMFQLTYVASCIQEHVPVLDTRVAAV